MATPQEEFQAVIAELENHDWTFIEERAARLLEQLRGRNCAGEVAQKDPAWEPYRFTPEDISSMLAEKHLRAERERTAAAE